MPQTNLPHCPWSLVGLGCGSAEYPILGFRTGVVAGLGYVSREDQSITHLKPPDSCPTKLLYCCLHKTSCRERFQQQNLDFCSKAFFQKYHIMFAPNFQSREAALRTMAEQASFSRFVLAYAPGPLLPTCSVWPRGTSRWGRWQVHCADWVRGQRLEPFPLQDCHGRTVHLKHALKCMCHPLQACAPTCAALTVTQADGCAPSVAHQHCPWTHLAMPFFFTAASVHMLPEKGRIL